MRSSSSSGVLASPATASETRVSIVEKTPWSSDLAGAEAKPEMSFHDILQKQTTSVKKGNLKQTRPHACLVGGSGSAGTARRTAPFLAKLFLRAFLGKQQYFACDSTCLPGVVKLQARAVAARTSPEPAAERPSSPWTRRRGGTTLCVRKRARGHSRRRDVCRER